MDRPRISASFGSGQLASPTLLRGESFFFEGSGGGGGERFGQFRNCYPPLIDEADIFSSRKAGHDMELVEHTFSCLRGA